MTTVAAIDLGASSGRVLLGVGSAAGFELREVHRFANTPVRVSGVLRWDVLSLWRGVLDGLQSAVRLAGALDSIGIDGWGVDYGLLDADGQLLANPAHYRDTRTDAPLARMLADVGAEALYGATGIQLQPFNTMFQFAADRGTVPAGVATRALLVPDLVSYWLTGVMGTELTNASTTALLDPRTMDWARPLAQRVGAPIELFAPLRRPGADAGSLLPDVLAETGLSAATRVIAVPSHDTAAAVAGVPADGDDFAFVCTGTWALVGVELPAPVITEASRLANFTNEVGVDGTIRFLRNVTGFWLLQECVREWRAAGKAVDLDELTRAAVDVPALQAVIDVQDPAFAAPGDMSRRITQASVRTGGAGASSPAEITRCILDSMALAIRHAVRDAAALTQRPVRVIHVVGGGVANEPFCQFVADACQLPVVAGPVEAASWGNVMSQARALGVVADSLAAARQVITASSRHLRYEPSGPDAVWARAEELVHASRLALS
jgi:rhamnulokinase